LNEDVAKENAGFCVLLVLGLSASGLWLSALSKPSPTV
jgi:hypothetical protein